MPSAQIPKAVFGHLAREPLTWLCAFAYTATWWGLEVFMPLGLATDTVHRSVAHYELAFIAGATAQALAVGVCLKMRWITNQQSGVVAVGTDAATLTLVAVLMGGMVVLPAEAFQVWQFADFNRGSAVAALVLGWLHLAAMISVVPFRYPLRSAGRDSSDAFRDKLTGVAWIAFATLVIPASLTGLSPRSSALLHILDPGRLLRASFGNADVGLGSWISGLLPIVGWGFVGLGLSQRGRSHPPSPPTGHPCATPSSETSTPI